MSYLIFFLCLTWLKKLSSWFFPLTTLSQLLKFSMSSELSDDDEIEVLSFDIFKDPLNLIILLLLCSFNEPLVDCLIIYLF